MKASDINEERLLEIIRRGSSFNGQKLPAILSEICEALPEYPCKVVLAKIKKLLKQRKIDGYGCGCRGDFKIVEI
ncbi:MAG: hypothetical protein SFW66_08950 [Gammaproteobacteria bacterium]|nr:hypothetical protein [Gammaproteobacteria bacterium]